MSALAGLVFLQMALIVAVSQAVGYVFRWLQQPLVVAQMLTGILRPTAGQAEVAGFVPWRQRLQ